MVIPVVQHDCSNQCDPWHCHDLFATALQPPHGPHLRIVESAERPLRLRHALDKRWHQFRRGGRLRVNEAGQLGNRVHRRKFGHAPWYRGHVQRELAKRHRFRMGLPRKVCLWYPLEHTARRFSFLFELCEQSVDYPHRTSWFAPASAALRTRACSAVHPDVSRGRCSSGNGPTSVCVNVMSVPSGISLNRYNRFEVAAVDMNSGPQISSSAGRLMLCTKPHRCPLSPPSSRYQRPPGYGSRIIGSGVPSGVSLSRPICATSDANVCSNDARTVISSVIVNVWFSRAVVIVSPPRVP